MTWQMDFNISKCSILQITIHRSISNFVYKIRATYALNESRQVLLYLGVYLQNKLSWTSHIDYIIISHKANRLLAWFPNTKSKNSLRYFKQYAYKQLVVPSIEYCWLYLGSLPAIPY